MLLGDILQAESVKLRLEAVTKYEAIRELLDVLIQAGEVPERLREHLIEDIIQREFKMSTGMEAGVAIPHASSDHIKTPIAAIGISRKGIPYETLDGKIVHLVVLLLFPRRQFQGNVRTLAAVARLLDNEEFRNELLDVKRRDVMVETIRRIEENSSLTRNQA
jgi:PTS system fructose-specific IIC component